MPRKKKPSLADLHTELQREEISEEIPVSGEIIPASISTLSEEISNEERLKQLETIIDVNLKAFYEVGLALKEVRDRELYQLQGFVTFEDYCVQRWDMHRAHAYRLIDSSVVMINLSPIGDKVLPTNESQVRPLTKLPPEQQQQVWEKVVESAPVVEDKPKITAKLVEEIVSEVTGETSKEKKSKDNKVTYKVSVEIDDTLNEAFYRIRQSAGKERKKLSKEAVIEVLLQMALESLGEKEEIVVERVLKKIDF